MSHYINSSLKSGRNFVFIFWLLLILITISDLLFLSEAPSPTNIALTAVLFVAATLIPFRPRLYGWVFLLLDTGLSALSPVPVGILGYVCIAVLFLWGWHRYTVDAAVGTPAVLGGVWVGSSFHTLGTVMLLIMLSTGFSSGYIMRRYVDERDAAVTQLWEHELQQLRNSQQLKNTLAIHLHDSLAGTLSVVTKLAETLRNEVPKNTLLESKAEILEEQARVSLKELRGIIQLLDSPNQALDQSLSFMFELERLKNMVSAAGIHLEMEYNAGDLELLPVEVNSVLSTFLREAYTNLIKFAAPSTNATLCISCDADSIEIMMKNQYLNVVRDSVFSSGKGLNALQEKFEVIGGELDVWTVNNWWYVRCEVPLEKGEANALK
ncbi:histidine kinase [Schaalia sp. ZJ1691]|uniref:sensor histidine kinase n=1 Tax=Schaalia sp. ZJ1691 TaxID=2709404 RepID=UPI0013E9D489|nr:histidine kinase [Schaalia sp. ZJ1691]